MYKLDFKQPIFGSNYLELYCKPLYGMIPAEAYIKCWFTEGGCDKFLRIFDTARAQIREQLKAGKTYHDNSYNQQIASGFFSGNAYHDPNDPTVVYTNQPKETLSNTTDFIGENYYAPRQDKNKVGQTQQQQMPNYNYPQAPPQEQQQSQQANVDYPNDPNSGNEQQQGYQQMQMGTPYNQNLQNQPYTVGMNNVPQYNQNQPGVSYYFGVPIGPTVQRNN